MKELAKKLEEIGLSSKESEVYIYLLKHGPIMGGDFAKILNMDRTHIYNLLRNLINKGLASHVVKNGKTFFQANSPRNLLNQIQKKKELIDNILPELLKLEKVQLKPSIVNVLEGKEGLRTILRMILESNAKELLVYGGTGKSYDVLEYELPHAAKKTGALNIKGKIITSKKLKGKAFTQLPNFEMKYVEEITPSSTTIFANKVAIAVFEEKPFVILIESRSVAQSYRNYFNYLWKQAKK